MKSRHQFRRLEPVRRAWQRATAARWRQQVVVGAALVAVTVAATACGSSNGASSPTSSSAGSSSSSTTASAAAFRQCLAENGVTPPVGGAVPGGPATTPGAGAAGNPNLQKALKACASLRPKGSRGGFGGNSAALAAYRNCLTLHGVSSGPASGSTIPTGSTLPSVRDTSNPTVRAALSACAALRPALTHGSGSTTTTTPTS
jgi:hypothetical protein